MAWSDKQLHSICATGQGRGGGCRTLTGPRRQSVDLRLCPIWRQCRQEHAATVGDEAFVPPRPPAPAHMSVGPHEEARVAPAINGGEPHPRHHAAGSHPAGPRPRWSRRSPRRRCAGRRHPARFGRRGKRGSRSAIPCNVIARHMSQEDMLGAAKQIGQPQRDAASPQPHHVGHPISGHRTLVDRQVGVIADPPDPWSETRICVSARRSGWPPASRP